MNLTLHTPYPFPPPAYVMGIPLHPASEAVKFSPQIYEQIKIVVWDGAHWYDLDPRLNHSTVNGIPYGVRVVDGKLQFSLYGFLDYEGRPRAWHTLRDYAWRAIRIDADEIIHAYPEEAHLRLKLDPMEEALTWIRSAFTGKKKEAFIRACSRILERLRAKG